MTPELSFEFRLSKCDFKNFLLWRQALKTGRAKCQRAYISICLFFLFQNTLVLKNMNTVSFFFNKLKFLMGNVFKLMQIFMSPNAKKITLYNIAGWFSAQKRRGSIFLNKISFFFVFFWDRFIDPKNLEDIMKIEKNDPSVISYPEKDLSNKMSKQNKHNNTISRTLSSSPPPPPSPSIISATSPPPTTTTTNNNHDNNIPSSLFSSSNNFEVFQNYLASSSYSSPKSSSSSSSSSNHLHHHSSCIASPSSSISKQQHNNTNEKIKHFPISPPNMPNYSSITTTF